MTQITFNRNSWHYRLATKYSNFDGSYDYQRNICEYSKSVVMGLFIAILDVSWVSVLLAPIADLIAFLFACGISGIVVEPTLWAYIGFIETLLTLSVFIGLTIEKTLYMIFYKIYKPSKMKSKKDSTSFIKIWYQSFHEKTCVPIDFN